MNLYARQREMRSQLLADQLQVTAANVGMQIYRSAYRSRLLEALRSGFAKTRAWVGDEAFETAAKHYILERPPRSFTLDDYGCDFPSALVTLFADDREVSELAWLEWTMQQAFAAVDEPVLDASSFAVAAGEELDWESVRLRAVRSVAVRQISTRCTEIWHALANRAEAPASLVLDATAYLLVWRRGLVPCYRLLDAAEYTALAQLADGCTLEQLAGPDDDVDAHATQLGQWLATWIEAGLIALPDALRVG